MPIDIESTIVSIMSRATSQMAREIATAVRESLSREILGLAGSATAAAPVRRGPGRPRKSPVLLGEATPRAAAPQSTGKRGAGADHTGPRKGWKRRPITDAEIGVVLSLLGKKPGLTSVQIQKEAWIESKQASRVLNKLRTTGRVKWKGVRSAATYSVG